jgi:hypothetical protein
MKTGVLAYCQSLTPLESNETVEQILLEEKKEMDEEMDKVMKYIRQEVEKRKRKPAAIKRKAKGGSKRNDV